MAKNTLHNKCKLLVNHFCSHAKFISWGKEIKIANKLFNKYINLTFWKWLSHDMDFKVNSLAFFLTKDGIKLLKLKYVLFIKLGKVNLSSKKRRSLKKNKVGKDKQIKKKPRNLRDFINYAEDKKN